MKRLITIVPVLLLYCFTNAQHPDPVHWNYSIKKISGQGYELYLTATMDEGWHIYSQTQPEEAVAMPTKIQINKNPLVSLKDKPKETGTKERYEDKQAGIIQYQYGGKVNFVQTVTLKAKVKTNLSGSITYQACTDEMCLPPKTITFNVALLPEQKP